MPQGYPADYAKIIEAAKKEGKVVVYATTDAVAANPLIKDFQALYPGIQVDYSDLNSTELYNRFIAEVAAGSGTADVLWSSAMDLQVKLAADGNAATYASPEIPALPKWAVLAEPGLRHDLRADHLRLQQAPGAGRPTCPQDHAALLELLNAKPDAYKGKITAYDPEKSGVGYLFVNEDAKHFPQAWDLFKAFGKVSIKLYTSAGAMIERVTSGEHTIAYGIFGSYALGALEEGSEPRHRHAEGLHARHLARRLHLRQGQEPERRKALPRLSAVEARADHHRQPGRPLFAARRRRPAKPPSSTSPNSSATRRGRSRSATELLANLDETKRLAFLKQWQAAMKGQ